MIYASTQYIMIPPTSPSLGGSNEPPEVRIWRHITNY